MTVGRIVSEDDLVTKTVYQLREYYQTHRNLTRSYWDVWMAKSVLREDFDQYGFTFTISKNISPGGHGLARTSAPPFCRLWPRATTRMITRG